MVVMDKKRKHVAVRTCVVCREKVDKHTLRRLVLTASGIKVDLSGKMDGRGAYLCGNKSCWERVMNTNILDKALRTTLTNEDRKHLRHVMPS